MAHGLVLHPIERASLTHVATLDGEGRWHTFLALSPLTIRGGVGSAPEPDASAIRHAHVALKADVRGRKVAECDCGSNAYATSHTLWRQGGGRHRITTPPEVEPKPQRGRVVRLDVCVGSAPAVAAVEVIRGTTVGADEPAGTAIAVCVPEMDLVSCITFPKV